METFELIAAPHAKCPGNIWHRQVSEGAHRYSAHPEDPISINLNPFARQGRRAFTQMSFLHICVHKSCQIPHLRSMIWQNESGDFYKGGLIRS